MKRASSLDDPQRPVAIPHPAPRRFKQAQKGIVKTLLIINIPLLCSNPRPIHTTPASKIVSSPCTLSAFNKTITFVSMARRVH